MLLCRNQSMKALEKTFNVRPTEKAEVNKFVFWFLQKLIHDAITLVS